MAPWKLGLGNNPHVVESRGEVITGSCGCRDLAFGPGANKAQGCWLWGLAEQQREEKLLGMLWLACLWLTGFDARVVDLGVKATDHYLSGKYSFFSIPVICLAFKYVLLLHIVLPLSRFLFKACLMVWLGGTSWKFRCNTAYFILAAKMLVWLSHWKLFPFFQLSTKNEDILSKSVRVHMMNHKDPFWTPLYSITIEGLQTSVYFLHYLLCPL